MICTPGAWLTEEGHWEPACACPNSAHIPQGVGLIHDTWQDAREEARALLQQMTEEQA